MRFIHAADIHLDSPLTGLSAYQDAPAQLLRTATRDAFENLVSLALGEQVDFMVIAGDLYDGNWRDFNTGIFFSGQMGRLKQAGIRVYLLYGNHDAESEMTKRLALPDNVHAFSANKAETFKLDDLQVALHGRSFKVAATTEDLVHTYPDPIPGWLNIGVLHTALEGHTAHANYAPCSVAELHAKGYGYWALGHVHDHQQWDGASTIAYPGNLQGRHIRETGPKGALMVTAQGPDIQSVERVIVDVLRWAALDVDVSHAKTLTEVVQCVGLGLEALVSSTEGSLTLAVRVRLTGSSPAHGHLFGLESQLRAEILNQAAAIAPGRLWIEKVKLETQPVEQPVQVAARADAIADLQSILANAEDDQEFLQSLREDLMQMVVKLHLDVLHAVPQLEALRNGDAQDLVRSVVPSLVAHVAKAE